MLFLFLAVVSTNSFGENIKVGISVPLTGPAVEYGTAVRNAFLLAKEEMPELKRYDYVFDDNAYLAAKSLDSFHKLRHIDGVKLIYVWGEPGFASIAPVAEAEKFPLFCMSTDRGPGIGKKYSIRVSGDSYRLAKPVVDFLDRNKVEAVHLIMAEDPYFEAARLSLKELVKPETKLLMLGSVPPDVTDFRSLILRLKNLNPKFTAVFLQAGQVRVFFTQAAALGLRSQFIGTDVFESREEIRESGKLIDGSVYANFYVPENFYKAYTEKFGNNSQLSHAYMAYAFAKSLDLIAPENSDLGSEVLLANVKKLDSKATGAAFEFKDSPTEGKHFEFPVVLREIKDGQVQDVK